jgi:predicted Zn-dependent protease
MLIVQRNRNKGAQLEDKNKLALKLSIKQNQHASKVEVHIFINRWRLVVSHELRQLYSLKHCFQNSLNRGLKGTRRNLDVVEKRP